MAVAELTAGAPQAAAARSRRRPVWRGLGVILAATLVLFGAFTLLDLTARHTFESDAAYGDVRSLVVDDSSGDVQLTGVPAGARLTVIEHITEGLTQPRRSAIRAPGGVLRLKASCNWSPGEECRVSYEIAVPAGVTVLASSGAGDVSARGLTTAGSLQLTSGAGDVNATAVSAPDVKLDSGAGNVTAELTRAARSLEASSGAGDVRLAVPNETYAVHASSGAGTVSDQTVRTDPGSPRRIDASSGAGDVTILTRGPSR